MNDTEILNALQAMLDEHIGHSSIRFDVAIGALTFVVKPPPPIHVPRATAAIQSGPMPDLRKLLVENLQPHLVRLVSNKLTKA